MILVLRNVRTLLLTVLVLATLGTAAAAEAQAPLDAKLMTSDPVKVNGAGSLVLAPTWMDFEPATKSGSATPFIRGESATLYRYERTTIVATAGPGARHDAFKPAGDPVAEFGAFDLRLDAVRPAANLVFTCQGFLQTALDASIGAEIRPAKQDPTEADVQAPGDKNPMDEFVSHPNGLTRVSQENPTSTMAGSFHLLLEDVSVTITSVQDKTTYDATVTVEQTPASQVTEYVYYVLQVADGTFFPDATPGKLFILTERVVADLDGTITVASASGTLQIGSDRESLQADDIDLAGALTGEARSVKTSDQTYALSLAIARPGSEEPGPVLFAAPRAFDATAWLPLGSVLGAFFVLGAVTLGWRFHGHVARVPAAGSATPPPAKGPRHSAVDHMENTYRGDPSNLQAALELGLTYGRAGRHDEALPLLLMAVQSFPKVEALRYQTALALLHQGRDDEGIRHLEYSFRLNPLNVARFLKEGPVASHGKKPAVHSLLRRWSRHFSEASTRGYA